MLIEMPLKDLKKQLETNEENIEFLREQNDKIKEILEYKEDDIKK